MTDEEIDRIAEQVMQKILHALRLNQAGALTKMREILQLLDVVSITDLRDRSRRGKISIRET